MELLNPQFISLPLATLVGGFVVYLAIRANHRVHINKLRLLEEEHMKSKVQLMDF